MSLSGAYGSKGPSSPFSLTDNFWEDLSAQVTASNLDVSSGRIDFDFTELTIDYATNARYPEEELAGRLQMPHSWALGTSLQPHIHWLQQEDNDPNWLLEFRVYSNDASPGAYALATPSTLRAFPYTSGDLIQITVFPDIVMTAVGLSGWVDYKFYRDAFNASGLFAGADAYTQTAKLKELDYHFMSDAAGSRQPFSK